VHSDNETNPTFDRVVGLNDTLKLVYSLLYTLVKAAIKKLKLPGASGPDSLPARRLKTGRESS